MKKYKLQQSKSSCSLDQIEGFIYGPFPSRFWMMRKHINQMETRDLLQNGPFHAWECLTLRVKNCNDVYLLVKNEGIMKKLIKMLIYELRTIDGNRNTAVPLIEQGVRDEIERNAFGEDIKWEVIEKMIRHRLMQKVWINYSLVRFKLKLSYHALLRNQTIQELWLHQIVTTFRFLRDSAQIKNLPVSSSEEQDIFKNLIMRENENLLKMIVHYN